jgi:hypothetical protein
MVVWRWAAYLHPVEGCLILVLSLPLRWAVKSVALLMCVHPTGVSSSTCMDQAAMPCQVPLVAIARKGLGPCPVPGAATDGPGRRSLRAL